MELSYALKEIIAYLANTREFNELRNSKLEVSKNPNIKQSINQFQKKQEALYSQKLSQSQVNSLMNELNKDYEQLSSIPQINRYFKAVEDFNNLMGQVIKELNTSIERKLS